MNHTLRLILVMVAFGLLGGVVNYIYSYPKGKKRILRLVDCDLLKSLITGIAASLMVPVFLNMISSDIVRESENDPVKLLVFAGFCVIAAASSKVFIKAISNKVLERVNKVEDDVEAVKAEIRPVVLKHTELEDVTHDNGYPSRTGNPTAEDSARGEAERTKVLQELSGSDYAFRTINGLARDANMNPEHVKACMEDCVSIGLAGKMENGTGIRFYITEDGQTRLQNHTANDQEQRTIPPEAPPQNPVE